MHRILASEALINLEAFRKSCFLGRLLTGFALIASYTPKKTSGTTTYHFAPNNRHLTLDGVLCPPVVRYPHPIICYLNIVLPWDCLKSVGEGYIDWCHVQETREEDFNDNSGAKPGGEGLLASPVSNKNTGWY